jgi:hypothetical protein
MKRSFQMDLQFNSNQGIQRIANSVRALMSSVRRKKDLFTE